MSLRWGASNLNSQLDMLDMQTSWRIVAWVKVLGENKESYRVAI